MLSLYLRPRRRRFPGATWRIHESRAAPIFFAELLFSARHRIRLGEGLRLFALNPEVVYRLPLSARNGRWTTYVGEGRGSNFTHESFNQTSGGGSVSFHKLHSDATLNILGGIQHRAECSRRSRHRSTPIRRRCSAFRLDIIFSEGEPLRIGDLADAGGESLPRYCPLAVEPGRSADAATQHSFQSRPYT